LARTHPKGGALMRITRFLTVFIVAALVLPVFGQEGNEAEKLLRKLEEKLTKAKTLRVSFETTMDIPGGGGKFNGSLTLAEGNRARMKIDGDIMGKPVKLDMTSNGTKMKAFLMDPDTGRSKTVEKEVPRSLTESLAGSMARAGVLPS